MKKDEIGKHFKQTQQSCVYVREFFLGKHIKRKCLSTKEEYMLKFIQFWCVFMLDAKAMQKMTVKELY